MKAQFPSTKLGFESIASIHSITASLNSKTIYQLDNDQPKRLNLLARSAIQQEGFLENLVYRDALTGFFQSPCLFQYTEGHLMSADYSLQTVNISCIDLDKPNRLTINTILGRSANHCQCS